MSKNQDWQILMYLCRAYYAFASKTANYSAMGKALSYAQRVSSLLHNGSLKYMPNFPPLLGNAS